MKRLTYRYQWILIMYMIIAAYFGFKMGTQDAMIGISKITLTLGIHSLIVTVILSITGIIALHIIKRFDINDEIVMVNDIEDDFIEYKQSIMLHIIVAVVTTICLFLFPRVLEYHAPVMVYYCTLARFLIVLAGMFIIDNIIYIIALSIDYKHIGG